MVCKVRKRRVTPAEASLWQRAIKDVAPYDPHKEEITGDNIKPETARGQVGVLSHSKNVAPALPEKRRQSRNVPRVTAYGAGDPKRDRLAANRRWPIERVLDLHGMTQLSAERAFHQFVQMAYTDGCRCVLIITGKGGPASASNMTHARMRRGQPYYGGIEDAYPRRGVLRDRLPDWADGPRLRHMIARLSKARPKDGGDGAFYLFLKA